MKLVEPKELSSDLINISIEENFSGLPRIGSVYVKGKDSSLADTLKIYQYPLELSLSRKTLDFGMSAESRTVIVTTGLRRHPFTGTQASRRRKRLVYGRSRQPRHTFSFSIREPNRY